MNGRMSLHSLRIDVDRDGRRLDIKPAKRSLVNITRIYIAWPSKNIQIKIMSYGKV